MSGMKTTSVYGSLINMFYTWLSEYEDDEDDKVQGDDQHLAADLVSGVKLLIHY